jgi:putative ABC transport system permease protein
MNSLGQDLRYAVRMLRRNPTFALVAVATLAVGIGVNSAIFSVLNAVLLRPLPVSEPERLVAVWEHNVVRGRDRNVVNGANLAEWTARNDVFSSLGAYYPWAANLTDGIGDPERVPAVLVTGTFFRTLAVEAALGRALRPEDAKQGAPDVAVLSDGSWKRRFGADPNVVGRVVSLNDKPTTIVGVMPATFNVPIAGELWAPVSEETVQGSRGRWLAAVARLKPGVTVEAARAQMLAIAATLEKEFPDRDTGWSVTVTPLHEDRVQALRPALIALAGAVGFVLLIACANVANLLLARAVGREREVAIRASIGAGPGRLAAQFLTESAVLGTLGAVCGLALGAWVLAVLLALVPPELAALAPIRLDATAVAFTLGLSLVSVLLFGLVPALHLARPALARSLKEGGAGSGQDRKRLRQGLVVAEVSLALVLLVGGVLLAKSFWRLNQVDPGFAPSGVLTMQVSLSGDRYKEDASQSRFFDDAIARLSQMPGAASAGAISYTPLGNQMGMATTIGIEGQPTPPKGQEPVADVRIVAGRAFEALGIPVRDGRAFSERDTATSAPVVMVNESLARRFWPGRSAVGQRVRMLGQETVSEIVGVVADVRLTALDREVRSTLYFWSAQAPTGAMTLAVRSRGPLEALVPSARAQLAALDPGLPVAEVRSLEEVVSRSLVQPRFVLILIAVFALTALGLAALGLYGVLAHAVSRRQAEVGVRLALGARPADIRRMILGEGLRLTLIGAAIGVVAAAALSRGLGSLLFGVSPADPVAYVAVAALVCAASLLAAWLPARRAERCDPMQALRAD